MLPPRELLPLLVLIAACISVASAASNCCTPETWLGQEWFAGEEGGMLVGCGAGTVYYDAKQSLLRLDYTMNVTYLMANATERLCYTVWFDYPTQIFYYYNNITKDCGPFRMLNGTTFPLFCTNAYGPTVQYLGNVKIAGATAQVWGNSTFEVSLTASDCVPIYTRAATSHLATGMNTIYWDVVPTLPSNWHHLPPHCQTGAPRYLASLPPLEAAAVEIAIAHIHRR